MTAPRLRFERARKVHRRGAEEVHALTDVDFEVHDGDFVVLTGHSGSGKSTLLHLGAGLADVDAGRVLVDGRDLATMSSRERAAWRCHGLGYVFQFFNLMGNLTALENVGMPLLLGGMRRHAADNRAGVALEKVGLGDRVDHLPSQLSGGQMQRVAVARALVTEAPLIFADEPTGNLDSKSGADVIALLRRAGEDRGCAVVLATHDEQVARSDDRLITLQDGHLSPSIRT